MVGICVLMATELSAVWALSKMTFMTGKTCRQMCVLSIPNMVVEDTRTKGITPLYLVTDHTSFYERYGWEFLCLVHNDGEQQMSRMYIHK